MTINDFQINNLVETNNPGNTEPLIIVKNNSQFSQYYDTTNNSNLKII